MYNDSTKWVKLSFQPIRHKWMSSFQMLNLLPSKLLVLQPNESPELENQQISRFCYLKIGHFGLRRAVKITLRHVEWLLFFNVTVTDQPKFTNNLQVCH